MEEHVSRFLSADDVKTLREWGYKDDADIQQIQLAIFASDYQLSMAHSKTKKCSSITARKVLGKEGFLGMISRSAFHWDSAHSNDNGDIVSVDSSIIFTNDAHKYNQYVAMYDTKAETYIDGLLKKMKKTA